MDRKIAQAWAEHARDFAAESPLTLDHAEIAFYLGALAYSDFLRQGVSPRQEIEDFLVANPLIAQR